MARPHVLIGSIVGLLVIGSACTEKPGISVDHASDAEIYHTVITDTLDGDWPRPEDPDDAPILYLEPIGVESIGLEVQVEVVAAFEPDQLVVFVDERTQAVDDDLPLSPVKPGAAYLGLGDISIDTDSDGRHVELRIERYHEIGMVDAFRYRLLEGPGQPPAWTIEGVPEDVDAEALVAAE